MMDTVVIFPNNLLLTDVVRDEAHNLVGGFVVNGGWWFEVANGEHLCRYRKGHPAVVTRHPATPIREVIVPADITGHYNDIIEWASRQ